MSWAETVMINGDLSKSLDKRIDEKIDTVINRIDQKVANVIDKIGFQLISSYEGDYVASKPFTFSYISGFMIATAGRDSAIWVNIDNSSTNLYVPYPPILIPLDKKKTYKVWCGSYMYLTLFSFGNGS